MTTLERAAELCKRVINMAYKRRFGRTENEMLIALLLAAEMINAGPGIGQEQTVRRIVRQARDFIDAGNVREKA